MENKKKKKLNWKEKLNKILKGAEYFRSHFLFLLAQEGQKCSYVFMFNAINDLIVVNG